MPKFETVPADVPDTQDKIAVRSHDRDEDQQAMDKLTEPLVKAWKAAGEPTADKLTADMTDRLRVAKGERQDVTKMVRRAMNLHGADPTWYLPTKPDANGAVIIKFGPMKRKPQTPKTPASDGQASATPTPTPTPPATPPADEKQRGGLLGRSK